MEKILIDTDAILDFFFDRKPFSDYAAQVLSLCAEKEIQGFITPVIVSNVYYLLRKTASHRRVVEKLSQLLNILEIIVMDRSTVLRALDSDFKDFEDALQNFSALENGEIKIILTRNVKDYKKSTLVVLSPETYINGRMQT